MTSISFSPPRATGTTVPLRAPAHLRPEAQVAARPVALREPTAARNGWVRVGTIRLRDAASYLLVWAAVMFAVLLLVFVGGYLLLWALGVTASVSKALAIVLGQPLPESGVLPILQPQAVVPFAVVLSLLLSGLGLVAGFAAVMVHNAVSSLTGGLQFRIRPAGRSPRDPRPRL